MLILLSVIVMAGATGLSYKAHYCKGTLSGISMYPGLGLTQSASCCCDADKPAGKTPTPCDYSELNKNKCCTNITVFSKLNIESPATTFTTLKTIHPVLVTSMQGETYPSICNITGIPFSDAELSPQPLSGRKLVLFLSQQRIPQVSYFC